VLPPSRAARGPRRPGDIEATMASIERHLDWRIFLCAINLAMTAAIAAKVWRLNELIP
jgi:hypothetical protein